MQASFLAKRVYDKNFNQYIWEQEDDLKKVNLGTKDDPKMVKVGVFIKGKILENLIKFIDGIEGFFLGLFQHEGDISTFTSTLYQFART